MQQSQRFHARPTGRPCRPSPGGREAVPQWPVAERERDRVAAADERFRLLLVLRADIDPDVGELGHLVPLLRLQQVHRPPGDDAGHRSVLRPDGQVLAEQNLHVPAADRLDVEEAVVVDVLHHEADLVAVPGEHDARRSVRLSLGMADGEDVAVRSVRTSSAKVLAWFRTTCWIDCSKPDGLGVSSSSKKEFVRSVLHERLGRSRAGD